MLIKRNVELLYEIGCVRNIDRTWKQFLGKGVANLAEHHFRVAWTAMLLAKKEGADLGKVAMMALIHDMAESRTGDVNYLSRQYTTRNEEKAIKDMFAETVLDSEAQELFLEYEKRETLESKVVKDADNLDVDIELRELEHSSNIVPRFWEQQRRRDVYSRLYTKSGQEFFDQIYQSDVHSWHNESAQNRFNGGDWKQDEQS